MAGLVVIELRLEPAAFVIIDHLLPLPAAVFIGVTCLRWRLVGRWGEKDRPPRAYQYHLWLAGER